MLLETCICIWNCDPAGYLLVDYESRGSAGASDFELKEELSDYCLHILHKCGRDSLPSFSLLNWVGMKRRKMQTGIRKEKKIFFETMKNVRFKILIFLKLLSDPDRNYTAPLVSPDFVVFIMLSLTCKTRHPILDSKKKKIDMLYKYVSAFLSNILTFLGVIILFSF